MGVDGQQLQVYHHQGLTNPTLTTERAPRGYRGGVGGGRRRTQTVWTPPTDHPPWTPEGQGVGAQPAPASAPPSPAPPLQPPDKGEKWDELLITIPVAPVTADPAEALAQVKQLRYKHLDTQISQQERSMGILQINYDSALETYHRAKQQLLEGEDRLRLLRELKERRISGEEAEDLDLEALLEVVRSHYEKLWMVGEDIWGLTKPIVISQAQSRSGRTRDNFRALAGRFYVRVDGKNFKVSYYREDGRIALSSRGGSKIVAPHCINGTQQCWGNYGPLLQRCQQAGDIGQILLLTSQHIGSATIGDGYMQLRIYAGNLDLPSTEDPDFDFFTQPEPPVPEPSPPPDNTIIEGGDLSPEEMAAFGLMPEVPSESSPEPPPEVVEEEPEPEPLSIHDDHLDQEIFNSEEIPF
jgi:hypothetical protein